MKLAVSLVLLIGLAALAVMSFIAPTNVEPDMDNQVRHVVVFKYTPEATEAQINEITEAFAALQDKIPGIVGFEHGINNSPEGKNLGFTHVYLMTFENEAARDVYLPHPDHAEFGKLLMGSGIFVDAFVVDYTL